VIEGEVEHRDVYLMDAEKARNDKMTICVSRAKCGRLVLDR
jgi:vanillate O-demethylase ferredoxin subunit